MSDLNQLVLDFIHAYREFDGQGLLPDFPSSTGDWSKGWESKEAIEQSNLATLLQIMAHLVNEKAKLSASRVKVEEQHAVAEALASNEAVNMAVDKVENTPASQ